MSSTPRTTIGLADASPALYEAMKHFMAVAYPGRVDLVTRELLRIYSGRESHCTTCKNLRLDAAVKRGFEESMVEQIDDPEGGDLSPERKITLRLATAFLHDPRSFSAADQDELLARFSPEQVAELLLDLIRFRPGSKLTVVAGTEQPEDILTYA